MKKTVVITAVVLTVIVGLIIAGLFYYNQSTVSFNDKSIGVAKFIYNDIQVETKISDQDLSQLTEVFEGKFLITDSPSCSFTEDVSLKIDNKTFCIACDTCGNIYLLEEDKYFHLSDEENKTIRKILENYGFKFPCI